MSIQKFFETHPVFHFREFSDFMKSKGTNRPQSWRQRLSYHTKAGHLIHIRKFLYAVKATINQDQWVDPYLIANKVSQSSVIAYHSALELHGVAYTTFSEITFIVDQQMLPFYYEAQTFRPISTPKILSDQGQVGYGIEEIKRSGLSLRLTSLERSMVDVLDRPNLGGGWEEIVRSFDNILQFDINKVIEYTLLLNNATTVAKVGFFLEQRPKYLAIESRYIEKLLPYIPRQTHYIENPRGAKGKYIEKWNIIVPLEIIQKSWEEPSAGDI